MIVAYITILIFLTIFSFGFVDANFPVKLFPTVFDFVHSNRQIATIIYISLVTFLFVFYLWVLRESHNIWKLIFVTLGILFFSFPAFSYDIFNYIATAKVAYFYKENPYLVMPIEIPSEPMLSFLHAANKVSLYGPVWILLTYLPHTLGLNNLLATLYAFKLLVAIFYLGLCYLIWRLSGKNTRSLAFFALNPLVVTESLVTGHNDVVMMFLALCAFFIGKHRRWLGFGILSLSIFIKGATILLLPVYLLKKSWNWSATAMFLIFLLSPVREELYPWYFIWPLTFISLLPINHVLHYVSYGFSFGLPLRFAPFVYFGDWGGVVPLVKKIVSFLPPALSLLLYESKKKH